MAAGDVSVSITQPSSTPCASFDGVDDGITALFSPSLSNLKNKKPFTIAVWVKPTLSSSQKGIFGQGTEIILRTITGNAIEFIINSFTGADDRISTIETLNTNEWNFIIAKYDGSNFYVRINNSTAETKASVGNNTGSSDPFNIGRSGSISSEYWKGFIRDLKLFGRSLSSAEEELLYNNGNVSGSLLAHWKLNGNALDSSGNGNHGTVSGAAFIEDGDKIDQAVTTQRSDVGSIAGTYLIADVQNGTQVITTAIDEA